MIASSRANGYCPGRCCNPNLLGCATLPREECTVTTGLQEKIHRLPHTLAIEARATPAEAGNLPQGGFRALALPPGICSDRHVLCSFGAALPELGGLTLWLMLRVSPCTRPAVFTFTVSAPRFRFDNNRMARMRLSNCIQGLRLIASSAARCDRPCCRWDELYAPGAALSIPREHTPSIHQHTGAPHIRARARTGAARQSQWATTRGRRGWMAAFRDSLRTASHSYLTVFDNALYRETILKKVLPKH